MSATRFVSLGCDGEKWATVAKQRQHWNTKDNVEEMTCYTMSNPPESGYRKRMHDL